MISSVLSILKSDEERNEVAELYETYSDRFYAIAYSKLHNRNDAEDAVIEAFSRIATKPEQFFRIPAHKRVTYVDVIVRNIAIDMFRHNIRTETISDEELDTYASDISVEDIAIGEVSEGELKGFIDSMPESKKSALILRIMYDQTTAEIAHALGISETAARKRLSDAGKMIKAFVEKGEQDG